MHLDDARVRVLEAEVTIRELREALARQLQLTDEARRHAAALEDTTRALWRVVASGRPQGS